MLSFSTIVARILHLATLLLASVVLASCGGGSTGVGNSQPRERTVDINYYRNGCVGKSGQMCLQLHSGSNQLSNFYDSISGFDYQWGYRYRLRIRETVVSDPPQDGSSINYTLLEQLDKQVETSRNEFSVWLPGADAILSKISPTEFALPDGKRIRCSGTDCATLDALIAQKFWTLLVLTLGVAPGDPLILNRIECSDAPASFISSCL